MTQQERLVTGSPMRSRDSRRILKACFRHQNQANIEPDSILYMVSNTSQCRRYVYVHVNSLARTQLLVVRPFLHNYHPSILAAPSSLPITLYCSSLSSCLIQFLPLFHSVMYLTALSYPPSCATLWYLSMSLFFTPMRHPLYPYSSLLLPLSSSALLQSNPVSSDILSNLHFSLNALHILTYVQYFDSV